MKNSDGIKEGNVMWRIDYLNQFDAPAYSFSLEDEHKVDKAHSSEPYIVTMINGDRLQQEMVTKRDNQR